MPQKPEELQRIDCYFDFAQGEKAYSFALSLIKGEFEAEMSYEPQDTTYRVHVRQKVAALPTHCTKLLADLKQTAVQFGGRHRKIG